MSPSRTNISHSHHESTKLDGATWPALKVCKGSHAVKKPSSSPTPAPQQQQQQRQPVIIYTHSPKVIHTTRRDFKILVQKLTGLYKPIKDAAIAVLDPAATPSPPPKQDSDETASSSSGHAAQSACDSGSLVSGGGGVADYLCPNASFYGYSDPFMFTESNGPSSTVKLEGLTEFREY